MPKLKLDRLSLLLFATLLFLDVTALVVEKLASTHAAIQDVSFYARVLKEPGTWIGIILGPIQLLVWSNILKRVELSLAFPVSSLSFPVTVFTSQVLLGEHISPKVWLAILIITAGVILIGGEK